MLISKRHQAGQHSQHKVIKIDASVRKTALLQYTLQSRAQYKEAKAQQKTEADAAQQ
jgi:hypothetical protein